MRTIYGLDEVFRSCSSTVLEPLPVIIIEYIKKKWGKNLWKRSSLASRKPKQMRTKRQFQKKRGASPCNKQEQKSNKSRLGFEEGVKTDKHQSRCCCLDDDATDGESVSDKIRARQSTLG